MFNGVMKDMTAKVNKLVTNVNDLKTSVSSDYEGGARLSS